MPRPLKFCFLSIFYPPYSFGGDAVFVSSLANALASLGHEVDVIHCVDSYKLLAGSEPTQLFGNHANVTVHSLHSRLGFLSPLIAQQVGSAWPKTDAILQVFYSKKFDVIHYHNISLFGPKALRLDPGYREFIKLYTAHEHWLICPMHVLWKNNERLCDTPECLRCTLKFRRPPQWWRYTHLLEKCAKKVDAFVSPSQFTRRMHQKRGFQEPMTVLPNFVAERELASSAAIRPWPRSYFFFAGRLEKIKGIETLFPAFRRFQAADLLIAGKGSHEASLRQQAAGIPNVHFVGQLSPEEIQNHCRHATAVVVPSLCYEVFPITFLEACRAGTPAIARDVGGMTEMIEQSEAGFLYRSEAELLAAMERLHAEGALRQEKGRCAHEAYLKHWTASAHLEAYFQLLEETAGRKLGFIPWQQPARASLAFPAVATAAAGSN